LVVFQNVFFDYRVVKICWHHRQLIYANHQIQKMISGQIMEENKIEEGLQQLTSRSKNLFFVCLFD